ncbi:MAG: ribosome maturation factor RimM [Oscillospiraceae bacterium]|jgi:16S rRNA processing protein RimM|nr:ribosome maturation factor RimM [Oscillospiraceae bacterium]
MQNYLEAGKIVNTHGIRGELRIEPWVDSAEFLGGFSRLFIDGAPYKLLGSRVHKSFLLASLEGVDDINRAMVLKGKTVYIDKSEAKLPEGGFFLEDIIGASVVTESGDELGKLAEILPAPAANVYIVRGDREILIPAVPEFILKTDVDAGVITVRLIDGM